MGVACPRMTPSPGHEDSVTGLIRMKMLEKSSPLTFTLLNPNKYFRDILWRRFTALSLPLSTAIIKTPTEGKSFGRMALIAAIQIQRFVESMPRGHWSSFNGSHLYILTQWHYFAFQSSNESYLIYLRNQCSYVHVHRIVDSQSNWYLWNSDARGQKNVQ